METFVKKEKQTDKLVTTIMNAKIMEVIFCVTAINVRVLVIGINL